MTMSHAKLHTLLRPYWKLLALAFAAMLLESATDLLEPWPLKVILDHVIGSKTAAAMAGRMADDSESRLTVLNAAIAAVIAIALRGRGELVYGKVSVDDDRQAGRVRPRHALYHHVQRLSLSFYEHRQTGDMVVRLTADIDAVEDFISGAVLGIVLDVVTLVGMLAVMFYLDWRFALIGLSVAPVLFVMVFRFMRRIKEATREVKKRESELASVVQESIASARVVKASPGKTSRSIAWIGRARRASMRRCGRAA